MHRTARQLLKMLGPILADWGSPVCAAQGSGAETVAARMRAVPRQPRLGSVWVSAGGAVWPRSLHGAWLLSTN